MKNNILLLIVLLTIQYTLAQEVAPLQLGNVWVYDVGSATGKITITDTNITRDSLIYNKVKYHSNYDNIGYRYLRLTNDDYYVLLKGSTYPEPNNELPYYKKDAKIGDSWTITSAYSSSQSATYTVQDTFRTIVFGKETTVKHLRIYESDSLIILSAYWTEEFGLLSEYDRIYNLSSLKGCVIDGVVYGDTSFVLVGVEDNILPSEFSLSQNYPNPFNPSTTIEYSIPNGDYITLEVYNILGEKIETLVSSYKQPGKYSIEFNGENLPSGTYIYVLKASDFVDTKKLLILK